MEDRPIALVTGATSGIGAATARALAAAGYRVVLAGRREPEGAAVEASIRSAGGEATFVPTDVRDPAALRALVARTVELHGGLDVAFNNAGDVGDVFVATHEQPLSNLAQVLDVNVKGVLASMQAELPVMLAAGRGAIVNNASIAGLIGYPGLGVYVASKHAVIGLTRAAAVEYAETGVRVNAVAPGPIDTAMLDRLCATPEVRAQLLSQVPMGRAGTPEEVASAVLWLADPANSYTTGQVIAVDGGFTTH